MDYEPLAHRGDPIDGKEAQRLVEAFLFDGWNTRDPDRVLACVTDDVVWQDPFITDGTAHGQAAVREWLVAMWQLAPDTKFELIDDVYLSVDGTKIAAPWRMTEMGLTGVDLYELRGRLISQVRTFVALTVAQAQGSFA